MNTENHDAAVTLTHHLLETGARRIAFVGDPDAAPDVDDRWRGVQDVVWDSKAGGRAVGAQVRLIGVEELRETVGAQVAADELRNGDLPDAYVCANDELALGLLGELRRAGVDVPGDRPGHRLGRRDGGPVRRAHHRPPADARARRHSCPAPRRADHRSPHHPPTRGTPHSARHPREHHPRKGA